ncbi:hypothetical protein PROFUN_13281 [Planoprotostelium fungivorum]|uniref:1-phosphatidylinositol 4-kinase n=1 Tax=Planoprotostelium fungivorum TaxID=1890364 RepID=A0A2P6N4T7_9EUKA|nr:hypothetical protein PROFUN_13281 [Planoprotostelium fungivorum]
MASTASTATKRPDSQIHHHEWNMDPLESSMNEDALTLEEKLETLNEKAKEISAFVDQLTSLRKKLQKKKATIKDIIQKKIEDNEKELKKWKELLFIIVDESLDEKIGKLTNQETYFKTTYSEFEKVLQSKSEGRDESEEEEIESEDPMLDDLLAMDLNLQPEGLTQSEATEMQSRIKTDFNVLLNEPRKSLRRTFAYVGGIIRGYLRRGKSNIDWIKTMRQLEGREFEERMEKSDPYVGTKLPSEEQGHLYIETPANDTWNSMIKLFESRHDTEARSEFCEELYHYYDRNPEDVEFYLPQLVNLLLNQYNTFQPLKKFILDKCAQSVHFALQTYLFVRASKDSREKPKKKKMIPESIIKWRLLCNQILSDIQMAIRLPTSPAILPKGGRGSDMAPPAVLNKQDSLDDLFHYPIQFMDNLIDISRHLGTVSKDQHEKELHMRLEQENRTLEAYQRGEGGLVYIPLLKPVGSADYHRVVRIPSNEAFAIPTYGRVLYYVVIEVIDKEHETAEEPNYQEGYEQHHTLNVSQGIPRQLFIDTTNRFKRSNGNKSEESVGFRSSSTSEEEPWNDMSDSKNKRMVKTRSQGRTHEEQSDEDMQSHLTTIKEISPGTSPAVTLVPPSPHRSQGRTHEEQSDEDMQPHLTTIKEISPGTSPAVTLVPPSPHRSTFSFNPNSQLRPSASNENLRQWPMMLHPDKPLGSHQAFGELWPRKVMRIKQSSEFGQYAKWRMQPLIVKNGDEVLQEELAMQLIVQFQRIFHETHTPVKVMPYRILAVTAKSGLIEPVPNSLSLDKLKKQHTNLLNFFIQTFGEPSEDTFKAAQLNFVKTMAGYSVICYLLQIKDRHNGNILLDASGNIIHIDFGYFLSKTISFEKAPFKLTNEFVEVMGGYQSPCYKEYCRLCAKGFLSARKHYKKIMMLIEMSIEGKGKKVLPCLQGGQRVLDELSERFHLDWSDEECEAFFNEMIEEARGSWRTIVYDAYQLILNNIQS